MANGSGAWSYTTVAVPTSCVLTATDTVRPTYRAAALAISIIIDTVAPWRRPPACDLHRPTATVDHVANDSTLTLTGTAEANGTVKVYDGATLLGSAVANGSGAWTYTTAALANGAHSLTATASDAAGNTAAFPPP